MGKFCEGGLTVIKEHVFSIRVFKIKKQQSWVCAYRFYGKIDFCNRNYTDLHKPLISTLGLG